jgi:surface antigen
MQYRNTREYPPQVGDILIYDSYPGNAFGHIAIISKVMKDSIEIVQQNMGIRTREKLPLVEFMGYYTVADYYVLGWLRME